MTFPVSAAKKHPHNMMLSLASLLEFFDYQNVNFDSIKQIPYVFADETLNRILFNTIKCKRLSIPIKGSAYCM